MTGDDCLCDDPMGLSVCPHHGEPCRNTTCTNRARSGSTLCEGHLHEGPPSHRSWYFSVYGIDQDLLRRGVVLTQESLVDVWAFNERNDRERARGRLANKRGALQSLRKWLVARGFDASEIGTVLHARLTLGASGARAVLKSINQRRKGGTTT